MKIGIDASPIIYETGVSWYTRNLVEALLAIDDKNEYVLFGYSLRKRSFFRKVFAKEVKTFPFPPTLMDLVWNHLHIVPIERLIGNLDVFHSSDWTQPPSSAFKVTTIHDLVPLRFPEISHPRIVSAHKARLKWVKKEVDRIIAVSEFTKHEIVELLDISPERIVVIPEAPNPPAKVNVDEVLTRLNIDSNYLLVVGADPRKNVPAIVQAFAMLNTKQKNKKTERLKLVIVGRLWDSLPDDKDIISVGHVANSDLTALYRGAQVLVYTSLYEGFGLPILDAMQAGCPVVTSNISSMPEVAGNAAVLVDPTNPQEIANGIEKVLSERQKWIKKGFARVKQFSWEKTARRTLEVYKEAR